MTTEKKTALVTGASRGIGRAIAMRLAKDGMNVMGTATSESGAASISEALSPWGGRGVVLDVCQVEAVDAAVKELGKQGQAPAVLVNNAGITRDTLLMRMKDEDWDSVIETDLTSAFRLSRAVMPAMLKARWGRIISVGSVVAASGNPGQANYCAAKAGLIGFSKSLAREIGARGITVNVVSPGFIETDMTHELDDKVKAGLLERITVRRLGSVDDIAAAVAFLASTESGYITGETLHVNGGMYMA